MTVTVLNTSGWGCIGHRVANHLGQFSVQMVSSYILARLNLCRLLSNTHQRILPASTEPILRKILSKDSDYMAKLLFGGDEGSLV